MVNTEADFQAARVNSATRPRESGTPHTIGPAPSSWLGSRGSRLLGLAAGAAAGAALFLGLVQADTLTPDGLSDGRPHSSLGNPVAAANGTGVVGPGQPCPIAQHAPVAELARAAKQEVWLPNGEVTDSWACGLGAAPIVMFGDVQVSYESGWGLVDVERKWDDYIEADGGRTTEIRGTSILVHEGTKQAPHNEVLLVHGDTLVRLLSLGDVPVQDLERLVASIDFSKPIKGR